MPGRWYWGYYDYSPLISVKDGIKAKSKKGAIGKEWWVGDEWGLGLNGQFALSSNEDEGETWTTTWVGIAFSATFN